MIADEQTRTDVALKRGFFRRFAQRFMDSTRFIFFDETSAKTNMTRLYGRAPGGARLVDSAPHGHWKTTTFVAGLSLDGIVAPVVFDGPRRDSDSVEITMPAGFEVEDLPEPVSVDYGFASYHSKTEVSGNVLTYNRTLEIREPNVPLSKVNDLKTLYRIIASDEKNTAVLRPGATTAKQ